MKNTDTDNSLDEAKRIMGRLVKTPPQPHDKADKAKPEGKDEKKGKPDN